MLDVIGFFVVCISVRLMNVAVPYDSLSPRTSWLLLVDAHALRTIRPAVLMLTIDRNKVIQLQDRITSNCFRASPPIRRAHLAVLILHPRCVSATPLQIKYNKSLTMNWNA